MSLIFSLSVFESSTSSAVIFSPRREIFVPEVSIISISLLANKDIEMIETSGTKISRRGEKITALEVEDSKTDKEKISDTTNDLLSSQTD